jgi:phage terminase large subunit-like protein
MRRAIRYVCDEQRLRPDNLSWMPTAVRNQFEEYVLTIAEDMRYNSLKYFRPFEHQLRFFRTGSAERRGILAANRIGKTVSTCYPEWWNGKRYDKPVNVMMAGEGWQQVALVLQNELLGTPDIKITENIGTGAIPRSCVVFETMRNDGANCIGVEIRHQSGANSYLLFANYTQEVRQMQGFKLNLAVFDEQPPDDFFSEIVTRTATTQGQVLCSFTPLKGLNGLVSKFWNHEAGYEHIRVAWDDVPEYDGWGDAFLLQSTRDQLLRDYLPYERDARVKGVPVMGKGAVFPLKTWPTYRTGDVDFRTIPNILRIIALDLGLVNDRTVISLMYWLPREQEAWLHTQIVVKGTDEANPLNYVNHLMRAEVFGTPIVLPPDAGTPGRYTMTSESLRQFLEKYDLNVYPDPIRNPPDTEGKTTNHKSFGINVMRQMMEIGTFHINENCTDFLREAQNYFVDEKGRFSDPDDAIDSARYALLGCLNGWAEPYDDRGPQARFEAAVHNMRIRQAARKSQTDLPIWKRSWSAEGGVV